MGAWIETGVSLSCSLRGTVAPYVGAWIETSRATRATADFGVAPYVGAWIETYISAFNDLINVSLPTWERGLKH